MINEIKYERNILYRCMNCRRIITSEYSLSEMKKNTDNKDILIFTRFPQNNSINYIVNNNKISCRFCFFQIGFTLYENKQLIGYLSNDKITLSDIKLIDKVKKNHELNIYSKGKIEFLILSSRIRSTLDNIKSFCKDFYQNCISKIIELLSIINNSLIELYNIVHK